MATLAKPTGPQPRIRACSGECKKGRNAEEDGQPPRVASYSHSRQLWAERVDRLLREDPDGLPYEPASSKEILPFPDPGDKKERLKELADKIKASGETPINYFTGDMPLYTAAGAVTRPPPGCPPSERLNFFQEHMWNLPALPTRPLLGDSAAETFHSSHSLLH
ncbi:hypothetical protein CVIRNUC_009405 [Coccomyxa viridis]|uniref:Uncharacterized protein n=1 Tax=Coccomyxa viridis TaxID=1274662 RepID=A0AAV1IJ32_9CHLO|nr:hypothetical protein CVIRNUC_009405 [Coccomyxa viridis]